MKYFFQIKQKSKLNPLSKNTFLCFLKTALRSASFEKPAIMLDFLLSPRLPCFLIFEMHIINVQILSARVKQKQVR